MSYFDDASLVMIPSGYKDQKVYSVKPLDGSGDLTFSRASSATRVASNGLIEKVRTNLALQSNTFSNASWIKTDVSVTSGQAGYDGTTNAWLVANTAASGNLTQTISFSGFNTLSFYAKAGTHNYIFLLLNGGGFNATAVYNLSTGAITDASGDALITTATSVGNGWWRITITGSRSNSDFRIYPTNTNGAATTNGNILVQNVQLEAGDIATDYIATTSAAVSVGPVSGVPRLDYLNSTCPRLLLEPQRTNVATYSEQFDNAAWSKTKATVTANDTISPDGYTNADKIVFADGTSTIYQTYNLAGATATRSVYIKGTAGQTISLDDVFASQPLITLTGQWQRITFTAAAPNGYGFGISTFGGATARTIWLWGAQAEVGAYATSYIPTLGTSVTRVADAASKTGISSLIGQTEGTIFAEINFDLGVTAFGDSRIQLSDGTTSNWIFIGIPDGQSSNLVRIYVNAPSGAMSAYSTNPLVNGVNKIAYGYKSGSFVLYINGVQAATSSTTLTMAACSRIDLQGAVPSAATAERTNYKQVLLFKTRLTNAQLAELTTL
jgi:hypothetical protein